MVLHGNLWSSDVVDDAIRKLEEAGFSDGDHGNLAGRCEQVIRDFQKLGNTSIQSDPDILAMTASMEIVMEFARKFDAVREADVELREKADRGLSTPEIVAMGDVVFKPYR